MKAYELLDRPEKWTQHTAARDCKGCTCDPTASYATSWCLLGALERCYGIEEGGLSEKAKKIGDHLSFDFPSIWNDSASRTWKEVHALLKELDI